MDNDLWHEEALKTLGSLAKENPAILSVSLFGSLSKPDIKKDRWSDIDVLVIVKDGTLDQFYPTLEWLKPFGKIFTSNQTQGNDWSVCHKVYFEDFKRMDIILATESDIRKQEAQWTKQRVVFLRSDSIRKLLEEKTLDIIYPKENPYTFDSLVNEFWYIAVVATTKVMRNDMLISLHLALELYRKCLELGMWLRDRETGIHIHRTGSVRNDLPAKINIKLEEISRENILSLIEHTGEEFDTLASEWSPDYQKHIPTFKKLIQMAQEDL